MHPRPVPAEYHDYPCEDYFADGRREFGHFDGPRPGITRTVDVPVAVR